ncbi:GNAT family N-acetyltransferase [Brevibacillus borstelensis]|uniref:GNAT family N-acetyltransferase n=1 Tax=Brevibacillus borstelensis TaxID=45462 RepID=UPI0030C27FDC
MNIRHARESDYIPVISVIDDWWGGRHMADMLPKLFFQHFQNTSFVVEKDSEMIAFLIGFVSQTDPKQAYIHFIGVHPEYRKDGIAKRLYEMFSDKARERGCELIRCVTSPVNKTSIAFHTRMGFRIEKGNGEVDGISVFVNYDGKGQDRVLFLKEIR